MCKYLSFRCSSIVVIDLKWLLQLKYIDIAFAGVRMIDFRKCALLNTVVADHSQILQVSNDVTIDIIQQTDCYSTNVCVSLGDTYIPITLESD